VESLLRDLRKRKSWKMSGNSKGNIISLEGVLLVPSLNGYNSLTMSDFPYTIFFHSIIQDFPFWIKRAIFTEIEKYLTEDDGRYKGPVVHGWFKDSLHDNLIFIGFLNTLQNVVGVTMVGFMDI